MCFHEMSICNISQCPNVPTHLVARRARSAISDCLVMGVMQVSSSFHIVSICIPLNSGSPAIVSMVWSAPSAFILASSIWFLVFFYGLLFLLGIFSSLLFLFSFLLILAVFVVEGFSSLSLLCFSLLQIQYEAGAVVQR